MVETSTPAYEALLAASTYYLIVFVVAEFLRNLLDQAVSKSTSIHRFFIELIGTATICTCVFENGVIIVNYGLGAFFIVSTILGVLFGVFGRGAYGTPMAPIEQFLYGEMKLSRLVLLIAAEALGGFFSWRVSTELWRHSLTLAPSHELFYMNSLQPCQVNYHQPQMYMIAFEIGGTFLMRMIFPRIGTWKWAIPAFVSAIFSFSIAYMGDAGLDPVVASSLFFGCNGISQQVFMLQYWFCPVIGWLLAARWDRSVVRMSRKEKKAAAAAAQTKREAAKQKKLKQQ